MENDNIMEFKPEDNKTKVEIEDYCYRFEEMKDAMNTSIDNITTIIKEQGRLVEIVEAAEDAEDFKEFVSETKNQIEKLTAQKEKLLLRVGLLTSVLTECAANPESAKLISTLSTVLGIFE